MLYEVITEIKLNDMIFIGDSVEDYEAARSGKIDFLTVEDFNNSYNFV